MLPPCCQSKRLSGRLDWSAEEVLAHSNSRGFTASPNNRSRRRSSRRSTSLNKRWDGSWSWCWERFEQAERNARKDGIFTVVVYGATNFGCKTAQRR